MPDPEIVDSDTELQSLIEDQEPAKPAEEAKAADPRVEALEAELEKTRDQLSNFQAQMVASMSNMAERNAAPLPVAAVAPNDDAAKSWGFVKDYPEVAPTLVKQQIDEALSKHGADTDGRVMELISKRDAQARLGQVIQSEYGDDISNRESKILAGMTAARRSIEPWLAPGTPKDVIDQLSYIQSAGLNPDAVGERVITRKSAELRARKDAKDRASALGSVGGSRPPASEPQITELDEELMVAHGLDPKNEDDRKTVLKHKATERMGFLDAGQLVGGDR